MPSATTMAARAVASSASSALNEPLLPRPKEVQFGTDDVDDVADGDKTESTNSVGSFLVTSMVCVVAAGACKSTFVVFTNNLCLLTMRNRQFVVAASAVAMVSVQTIAVFVAGGICCLNAPTIVQRHHQISSSPSE